MAPLVSIITVCRNDCEALQHTFWSVSSQDHCLFEWIVVDGASTDSTISFLSALPPEAASWLSEPDRGLYDAMNKGIKLSKGKYCVFMNAGDVFAGFNTLALVQPLLDDTSQLVYGDAIEILGSKEDYKPASPASRYWYSMFTHHQAIFYQRQAISEGYDLSFRLAADWALTSRLLMNGAKDVYIPVALCKFRRGGSSDAGRLRSLANRELWRIYREVHGCNLATAIALYAAKRIANVLRFSAAPIYRKLRMRSGAV